MERGRGCRPTFWARISTTSSANPPKRRSWPSARSSRPASSAGSSPDPDLAREAHIEGVVILEATTDIYGRVASVRVLRGHALLDAAAVDAVRQWVYEPLLVNGRPRPVTFTVTVRFVLQK